MKRLFLACLTLGLAAPARAARLDWSGDAASPVLKGLAPAFHALQAARKASGWRLYAQAIDGQFVDIKICDVNPTGGTVILTLSNGAVGALFTSPLGQTVRFQFDDLKVSSGNILYKGQAVGRVDAGKPSLGAGYALGYRYGGLIDSCTGADTAAIDVFLEKI